VEHQATQAARGAGPRAIVISMHSHLPFPDSAGRGAGDERADVACAIAQGEVADAPPDRRLVVVFDSPVGRELVLLAPRLGWSVVVLPASFVRYSATLAANARKCLSCRGKWAC